MNASTVGAPSPFGATAEVEKGGVNFIRAPGAADGAPWRRGFDTFLPSPNDIVEWQAAPPVPGNTSRAGSRSVVILYSTTQ